MPQHSLVKFHFQNISFSFRNRRILKAFIASVFKQEGKDLGHLDYVFCTDKELLRINRAYLGHDYYTDIITFDLSCRIRQVMVKDLSAHQIFDPWNSFYCFKSRKAQAAVG